jgi:hypothetical protein
MPNRDPIAGQTANDSRHKGCALSGAEATHARHAPTSRISFGYRLGPIRFLGEQPVLAGSRGPTVIPDLGSVWL